MGNVILFKPPKFGTLIFAPILEAFRDAFPVGVVNTAYGWTDRHWPDSARHLSPGHGVRKFMLRRYVSTQPSCCPKLAVRRGWVAIPTACRQLWHQTGSARIRRRNTNK